MKFKFMVMPDEGFRVESALKKDELIAWQLESISCQEVADMIFEGIKEVQSNMTKEWHMSFNITFLSITKNKINCSNSYNEDEFIEITLELFVTILNRWVLFIKETKYKKNYRKLVEF